MPVFCSQGWRNLVKQGLGIRNDLLAAQAARCNSRQREIQARNRLAIAWATYNRYFYRPLETVVPRQATAAGEFLGRQHLSERAVSPYRGRLWGRYVYAELDAI
jgi:hypothetical protein